MGKQELNFEVPAPPVLLPEDLQKRWREDYIAAMQENEGDQSMDGADRVQYAMRESNRVLRVTAPTSYAGAKRLADWQVLHTAVVNGQLAIVTIDGKKLHFDVPEGDRAAADAKAAADVKTVADARKAAERTAADAQKAADKTLADAQKLADKTVADAQKAADKAKK